MVPRLLGLDLPSIDELLDEGVVPCHLVNFPLVDDVHPGIAHVRDVEGATIGDRHAERGPHALALGVPIDLGEDRLVREGDGASERAVVRGSRDLLFRREEREERARDGLGCDPARNIPPAMSPHPVRHHQEESGAYFGQERRPDFNRNHAVLVDGSNSPYVRGEADLPSGRSNDRVGHPRKPLSSRDISRQLDHQLHL